MSMSVSSPNAALLFPVGRPIGAIAESGSPALFHVRLGTTVFRLEPAEAAVWLLLHSPRPGTSRGMDRGLLAQLELPDEGVDDVGAELEHLLDLGLVVEIAVRDEASRSLFASTYRLVPLQFSIGNTPDDYDSYVLIAGEQPTVRVDLPMLRALTGGLHATSLRADCYMESAGLAVTTKDPRFGDPDVMLEHVLGGLHAVLGVHGAYLDLEIPLGADGEARTASLDPSRVAGDSAAKQPCGVYARGYLVGGLYGWLGLEKVVVSLGGLREHLWSEAAWYTWVAAHGAAAGGGVDDSIEAICASARAAGAEQPMFDIDDLTARQLIEQPQTGAELIELARTNRLEPLLAGIGNASGEPEQYLLGIGPGRAVTSVPRGAFEVWRDATMSYSLLDAAQAAGRAGSIADLRDYLRDVQLLCLRRAAFIDAVRPG